MKKRFARLVSVVISLCFVLSLFPYNSNNQVNADNYTASAIQQRILDMAEGRIDNKWKKGPHTGANWDSCKNFINALCTELYGYAPGGNSNDTNYSCPAGMGNNATRYNGYASSYNFADTVLVSNNNWAQVGSTLAMYGNYMRPTEVNLRTLFSSAQPGDIVQMDYTKTKDGTTNSIHTMMVYSVSNTGVVFYHYYVDGNNSVVCFGANNNWGSNPLFSGTTSGNEISYANLARYFSREDDGLSIYRAKCVVSNSSSTSNNTVYVGTATELLDALDTAASSSALVDICLTANISIESLSSYASDYPNIIKTVCDKDFKPRRISTWTTALELVYDLYVANYGFLDIKNCRIHGDYFLSVDEGVRVNSGASIELGTPICLDTYKSTETRNNSWFKSGSYIVNYGSITNCSAAYRIVNYAGGRIHYCSAKIVNNRGTIVWASNVLGENYGRIDNLITGGERGFFYNFGQVGTWLSNLQAQRVYSYTYSNTVEAAGLIQVAGFTENAQTSLHVVGGSYIPNSVQCDHRFYSNSSGQYSGSVSYSLTLSGLNWDEATDTRSYSQEQAAAIGVLNMLGKSFEWYSPDGTGNITYSFSSGNLIDFLKTTAIQYVTEVFPSYSLNAYSDATITNSVNGNYVLNLNGYTLTFDGDGDSFNVTDHSTLRNGVINITKKIQVNTPHTLELTNVNIVVDDSVSGSPFTCNNGRVVFENCTSNNTVAVDLNTTSDVVEVIDSGNRSIDYMFTSEAYTGNADYVIRTVNSNLNGTTSVVYNDSTRVMDTTIFSNLTNALSANMDGQYTLHSDAAVDNISIPLESSLTVSDGTTLYVNENAVFNGSVNGSGSIVIPENATILNNNNTISDTVNVVTDNSYRITFDLRGYDWAVDTVYPQMANSTVTLPDEFSVEIPDDSIHAWVDSATNEEYAPGATIEVSSDRQFVLMLESEYIPPEEVDTPTDTPAPGETVTDTPTPAPESTTATTPTPGSTSAPVNTTTQAPTNTPTNTPTEAPESSESTGVGGFVERLYTVALGRNSDPVGQQQWVDTITSGQNTGADVARGFLYSPEFLNKNSTDEEFVRTLYRTFFGREADEGGLNAWVGVLRNGEERQNVIEGFINSTEWANLCLTYGIPSGGTGTPNIEVEPNQDTIDFATRLYTTCLNRNADEAGLMAWARQLANQRDTGTGAARGFFFSSEFINQNVGNGEFVTRLYRTFMGREPDQAGYDAWVGQLDSGVSREEVFNGFAQSQEFTRICARYGIIRGS